MERICFGEGRLSSSVGPYCLVIFDVPNACNHRQALCKAHLNIDERMCYDALRFCELSGGDTIVMPHQNII